jgi:environmental stress-induced protein Ves
MMFLDFCLKFFFDIFLVKFGFQSVSTWSNFGGCSAEIASPKNSNTPDLFYSRMDLSTAIIKLGLNFFTFPTIGRTCTILIKNET